MNNIQLVNNHVLIHISFVRSSGYLFNNKYIILLMHSTSSCEAKESN